MAAPPIVRLLPGLAASAGACSAGGGEPMPPSDDPIDIADLVDRACGADEEAWQRLWRWLDPPLTGMIRGFHMGRISHEEDERRAVVLEVMARLREDGFR